jgi:hypothetical protein
MLWKWHTFSQIALPPPSKKQVCSTTTNQKHTKKFALAINACWQNFFYDMCVTPANIAEEHLQHLAGCIGLLKIRALKGQTLQYTHKVSLVTLSQRQTILQSHNEQELFQKWRTKIHRLSSDEAKR